MEKCSALPDTTEHLKKPGSKTLFKTVTEVADVASWLRTVDVFSVLCFCFFFFFNFSPFSIKTVYLFYSLKLKKKTIKRKNNHFFFLKNQNQNKTKLVWPKGERETWPDLGPQGEEGCRKNSMIWGGGRNRAFSDAHPVWEDITNAAFLYLCTQCLINS